MMNNKDKNETLDLPSGLYTHENEDLIIVQIRFKMIVV